MNDRVKWERGTKEDDRRRIEDGGGFALDVHDAIVAELTEERDEARRVIANFGAWIDTFRPDQRGWWHTSDVVGGWDRAREKVKGIPMSSATVSEGVHGRANALLRALEEIVPIEAKPGDYAELVDADGKPIPPGYNPNPDTTTWWVRCSSKDDVLVWLLPFAAWQKLRDIAAARWHGIP